MCIDINKFGVVVDVECLGVSVLLFFEDLKEFVLIEIWVLGMMVMISVFGGVEILVLNGSVVVNGEMLSEWVWLCWVEGEVIELEVGVDGVWFWIKIGYLDYVLVFGVDI